MTNIRRSDGVRGQTVKDTSKYLLATVAAQGMGFVRSILLPVLFVPFQMGIWNLMNVIIAYGASAHLGILHGMNKIIPLLRGQEKPKEIEVLRDSVFWVNSFLAAGATAILFASSFFAPKAYRVYLWIVAAVVFLQSIFAFQFSLLRANSSFALVSRGIFILSACSAFFVISLAFLFPDRLLGGLIGLAIAHLCTVAYWFVKSKLRYPFQINLPAVRQSFVVGIPLIIIGVLDMVFISIDRWIIVANLGITVLGYYSLGIMINNLISVVPGSVSSVLYPKMLERFAVKQDVSDPSGLFLGALRIGAIVMLILICSVSFGLPVIIKFFLPKYLFSVPIIKILVLGSFLYSLSLIAGSYLVSIDKQRWLMVLQVVLIGLLISSYAVALSLKCGIIALSWITTAGYSLFGTSYIFLGVYLAKGRKMPEAFRFMTELVVPFLLMTILIIATESIVALEWTSRGYLQSSALGFLLIMSIVLPVAWALNRDRALGERVLKELKFLKESILVKIPIGRKTGQ